MSRSLNRSALAILAAAAFGGAAPAAQAAPLRAYGSAVVTAVDGPGLVTVRAGGRRVPIRLFFVDVPKPGECGASESVAALRGFVSRAPKVLRYELSERDDGRYARDPDGRMVARLSYRVRRIERDLSSDLIRAEWARPGERVTPDPVSGLSTLYSAGDGGYAPLIDAPRAPRGVWASCGGRLHLPLTEPVPSTAPATWSVDELGVTTAVGPLTLSAALTPAASFTLRQLSELAPTEITRWDGGCRAWVPSLQIRAWSSGPGGSCEGGFVMSIRTSGPAGAQLSRGGAVGRPASDLAALFPLLKVGGAAPNAPLAGPSNHQWAWQTEALVDERRRLAGLATFASPQLPRP